MTKSLQRFSGVAKKEIELDQFEPIYGLSKRSLVEWLSHNPSLKKDYEDKLLIWSRQGRSTRDKWENRISRWGFLGSLPCVAYMARRMQARERLLLKEPEHVSCAEN